MKPPWDLEYKEIQFGRVWKGHWGTFREVNLGWGGRYQDYTAQVSVKEENVKKVNRPLGGKEERSRE